MRKKYMIFLSAVLALLSVACSPDYAIDSLSGVWEGPMTVSDGDIHVKIMNIEESVAELYDMKYTFDGYEVACKNTSSLRIQDGKKGKPLRFQISIDGSECGFFLEDGMIGETEGDGLFKHTDNSMSHYRNGLASVPGYLPTDKEYVGPSIVSEKPQSLLKPSLSIDWTDLLAWVGEAMVKSASSMAASAFLEFIFSNDSASASLDDVLSHIDEIKDMLETMITLYHNSIYEGKLNERSELQYEMHNHNYEAFVRLKNASDESQKKEIIKSWADRTVSGNPAYEQALNYMDFLRTTIVEQKDIFNMYDLYTYNTTPWEHQGYDYREALREGDIAAAAEGMFLAQYYHMVRTDLDEVSRSEILKSNANKFKSFCDFVQKHPVVHHDDMAICQIPGAHLAMDKNAISYPSLRNPSWCSIPTRWTRWTSDEYFMWGPDQAENYSQAINPEEMSVMMQYYGGSKNVYEILAEEAGCKISDDAKPGSGKRAAVCLQSGYYPGDWREIGLASVVLTSSSLPYQIEPMSAGCAVIDGAGIFAQYLQFYKWKEFYDDIVWMRTKVVER